MNHAMPRTVREKARVWFLCDGCSQTIKEGAEYMMVVSVDSCQLYHLACYQAVLA